MKWTRNEIKEAIETHGPKYDTKTISRNKKKAIVLQNEVEKFRNVSMTDIIRFVIALMIRMIITNGYHN